MSEMNYTPRTGETVWSWLIKIFTGLLLFFILGFHFLVNHYLAPEGLMTWSDVVEFYQNPIVPVLEGFFLVFVISHSLIGIRGIILDLNPSKGTMRIVTVLFWIIGIGFTIYGIWLLIAVVNQGA
ncbi:MAG: hypothetical protein U9R58_12520 [Chloroflexota bacterium]|nr:hypothetical protein [Chloroflexota bacterium]